MKKLTAITLFVLLASGSAFAKKSADEISDEVKTAFQKSFTNATDTYALTPSYAVSRFTFRIRILLAPT